MRGPRLFSGTPVKLRCQHLKPTYIPTRERKRKALRNLQARTGLSFFLTGPPATFLVAHDVPDRDSSLVKQV